GAKPLLHDWASTAFYPEADERTLVIGQFSFKGKAPRLPPSPERIVSMTHCAGGGLLCATGQKLVHIFDLRDRKWLPPVDTGAIRLQAVQGVPRRRYLYTAADGIVRGWDLDAKEPVVAKDGKLFPFSSVYYKSKAGSITGLALDPTGQTVAWADP